MGSFTTIDRSKPIGYQRTCLLSDEALQLFPDLELTAQEREWCNWTPNELAEEKLEKNEYAIKKFSKKLNCCGIVDALLNAETEPVRRGIESVSTHLTGGSLDKYFFRHAYRVRSDAELQKRIRPVLDALSEAASDELKKYVIHGKPEVLDRHYRNFHVFSITVARLNPALAPALHQEFSRILGSHKAELAPYLLLVSLRALGYASQQVTEWDEQYVQPWRRDPGSAEGWARGAHTAAYNAPSKLGWGLLQMHPRSAKHCLRKHKDSILRSLILEMYRKCCDDPCVNSAWLAARFFKLHQTLHVLNGRNAYKQLPEDLALKVLKLANTVGRAVRRSPEKFDGKVELEKITGSVEAFLAAELAQSGKAPRQSAVSRNRRNQVSSPTVTWPIPGASSRGKELPHE